ncbi:MAG TPA: DNA methyltransferase, partial [Clostridiales bacterium]|nr:DNA methyltransferase [Clostridiales bacterium]
KEEIVKNGYDLSINKYKKTEVKPIEYPAPSVIMAEIKKLNTDIAADLAKLEELLK